jgi:RimJ/RimL family protein N-acetyltransferase
MIAMPAAAPQEGFRSKAGRTLVLRPATRDDRPALAAMMTGLSPATVQRRYLTRGLLREETARREAERLTRPENAGMVLVAQTRDGDSRIVAVAELAQDQAEPGVAEGAVVVADAYQGEGIGRAVVERLATLARGTSIRTVRATTSASNTAVRRLIASLGRPYTARFAGSEVLYELAL